MGCDVYANGDEIACKAGDNKVIASFPDVCLTPPPPPAGPIPIPYPNTSFSKDMQSGSKSVMIKDQEVMLKDQSFYKTSPLGDEAATNGQGANVINHGITGKTYCVAWSMDVKFEDQNVDRHTDLTTSNHASPTAGDPKPDPTVATKKLPPPGSKCPCCEQEPPHANQYDPDTGEMYKPISEEEFYKEGGDFRRYEASPEKAATVKDAVKDGVIVKTRDQLIAFDQEKLKKSEDATKTLEEARKKDPPCPNLHKEQKGCGQYLNKTNPEPKTSDPKVRSQLGFTDGVANACIAANPNKPDGTPIKKKGASIVHKTPLSAGGCPSDQKNLIPKDALTDECKKVDEAQSTLQNDKDAAQQAAIKRGGKTW
jgi:hypothetical protein